MLFRKKGKSQLVCKKDGCGYKADLPEELMEKTTDETNE